MEWLLVGRWLLVLGVVTAVGAPLAAWLFSSLPRRGAAFSLPVALPGLAVVVFLVGQVTFGVHTVVYGGLVALAASYCWYRGWPRLRGRRLVAAGVCLLAAGTGVVLSATVLVVTAGVVATVWWLVRTDEAGFEGVLLVAGVGLVLSLEVVFAKVAPWPSGPPRWNTSLKAAVHGWTLAAVGAGSVAAMVLSDLRERLASDRPGESGDEGADGGVDFPGRDGPTSERASQRRRRGCRDWSAGHITRKTIGPMHASPPGWQQRSRSTPEPTRARWKCCGSTT